MNKNLRKYVVSKREKNMRFDKFLSIQLDNFSRVVVQKLIKEGNAKVNGKAYECSNLVNENDHIVVEFPKNDNVIIDAENFIIPILYEDDSILVIDKPANLVVHPSKGNLQGTLVNQLLGYKPKVFEPLVDGQMRPGIVHRLDKDTTGVMVIAKNKIVTTQLYSAFKKKKVKKDYLAIVKGIVKNNENIINTWYGHDETNYQKMAVLEKSKKRAIKRYRILGKHNGSSCLQIRLETGRTHQIRVHMAYLGYPILGDKIYAPKNVSNLVLRHMLHAWRLSLYHPVKKELMFFESPIPKDFIDCAKQYNMHLS